MSCMFGSMRSRITSLPSDGQMGHSRSSGPPTVTSSARISRGFIVLFGRRYCSLWGPHFPPLCSRMVSCMAAMAIRCLNRLATLSSQAMCSIVTALTLCVTSWFVTCLLVEISPSRKMPLFCGTIPTFVILLAIWSIVDSNFVRKTLVAWFLTHCLRWSWSSIPCAKRLRRPMQATRCIVQWRLRSRPYLRQTNTSPTLSLGISQKGIQKRRQLFGPCSN
mmetsp:Transcript_43024/g.71509  ORF Transcript_43024/g.71509 Transcript_43024/m.71509 type:complete len:220 (-) Transcript_43024:1120-1779(-)